MQFAASLLGKSHSIFVPWEDVVSRQVPPTTRYVSVDSTVVRSVVPPIETYDKVSLVWLKATVSHVSRRSGADEMRDVEFEKYSGEDEFFGLDWELREVDSNDPITSSTWVVPGGMTIGSESSTDTTTQARIGGGAPGRKYLVTNMITTQSGQKKICQMNFTIY